MRRETAYKTTLATLMAELKSFPLRNLLIEKAGQEKSVKKYDCNLSETRKCIPLTNK